MSYFFPAQTNHRRVRSQLMRIAMRKLSQGSITGRRAVEGVTHILKGATYIPQFNEIPLDDALSMKMLTAKQAAHHSGTGRGLRKGALWCEALNRAGIPVELDYYKPGTVDLPDLVDSLVECCTEALTTNLTQKDIETICHLFGLPVVQVGPAGWTDVHDVLQANAVMATYAAKDAAEAGDMAAAEGYAEQAGNIAEFTMAHAEGKLPDVELTLDKAAAAAAQMADGTTPQTHQIAPTLAPEFDALQAMIDAAVEAKLAEKVTIPA